MLLPYCMFCVMRMVLMLVVTAGLSAEQLARMRQVNSFLEHNLRESSEMLASLSRLQEEKQQLRRTVSQLQDQLRQQQLSHRPDMYGRYLRSESYRKALVWQKRYLLVHISGGYMEAEPPVLRIGREPLGPLGRFRSAVHAVVAVSRMHFLVRRWRSGKRAGARLTPTSGPAARPWSAMSNPPGAGVPPAGAAGGRQRPDSLSLHSSHAVLARAANGSATPPTPRASGRRSVVPPGSIRRSASLREPDMDRARERSLSMRTMAGGGQPGGSERERSASLLRSPSSSSSSLHRQPPVVTGRTPPTRDTAACNSRINQGAGAPPLQAGIRRSLDSQFTTGDNIRKEENCLFF
jgi:hypothetical protein